MIPDNRGMRGYVVLACLFFSAAASQAITNRTLSCSPHMFTCEKSRKCISAAWRCDLQMDCQYGEDESNCDFSEQHQPYCISKLEYHCRESKISDSDQKNSHGFFSSHTPNCIPTSWRCDGKEDCINGDDEENCPKIICNNETQFECMTKESEQPTCIPKTWVCDEQTDCFDESDEKNCTKKEADTCGEHFFRCTSGGCVYSAWLCDGEFDCLDGSDEQNCEVKVCDSADNFKCATSNTCIPASWHCDGKPDCPDRSDESGCNMHDLKTLAINCSSTEFQCNSGAMCISSSWVCDGDVNCLDGSDEFDCKTLHCSDNERMCANGKSCYGLEVMCDGFADCEDHSDEPPSCNKTSITNKCNPVTEYTCPGEHSQCILLSELCILPRADCMVSVCHQNITTCKESDSQCICRKMGNDGKGKLCQCKSGLKFDGNACVDIDECEDYGICDQICINKYRGYTCDCYPGYMLTIGSSGGQFHGKVPHKCRAIGQDPKLLLSNRATIRQYDIATNKYHPLISSLESAVALDYWHKNQTLIWSDVAKKQIMICHIGNQTLLNNIGDCLEHGNVTLISEDIQTPDGLAIDWVHGLLFWTDTGYNTISVFDLQTKRRKVIIDENLDEPRAIAVDPSAGLIFWTDWGVNACIERAGMDGQNRIVIMKGDTVRWPNGLALDILARRLYWADAKLKTISSCDYWGNNVRTVLHSHRFLRHPFSLAVFEEKLYWTDWDHEGVISVNKFYGNDAKTLVSGMTGPMTVRVYHKQAQPEHPDKCENHQCDHLCLPRAYMQRSSESLELEAMGMSYTCACDRGFKVSSDDSTLCVPLNDAIDLLNRQELSSNIPYLYFALLFVVAVTLVVAFTHYRPRSNHFTVLHFDNPIYRRTVEDLDTDLENPTDNSLGAISTLPVTSLDGPNSGRASINNRKTAEVKLMLGQPRSDSQSSANAGSGGLSVTNVTDSCQYSFDQPRV